MLQSRNLFTGKTTAETVHPRVGKQLTEHLLQRESTLNSLAEYQPLSTLDKALPQFEEDEERQNTFIDDVKHSRGQNMSQLHQSPARRARDHSPQGCFTNCSEMLCDRESESQ